MKDLDSVHLDAGILDSLHSLLRRTGKSRRDGKHNYQRSHYAYVLRTGAVHCITHLLTCDSLDDLLLGLLCNLIGPNRQSPVGPDEMAGVAVGIPLEVILMLGFGLPEVACRNDFGNDLARPQA
jgi:hypothetical protein